MPTTVRLCVCARRMAASAAGEFVFLPHAQAWVFTDDSARREMSPRARYYAFSERAEYRHEDHSGEPFHWVECPFCQEHLPSVTLDVVRELDGLGGPDA